MFLKLAGLAVFALLLVGFAQRHNRRIHIPIMVTAFLLDMGLVMWIELARGAVEQLTGPTAPMMKLHLFLSIGTVVLYLTQIISGYVKARYGGASIHLYTGYTFLLFRFGNLVTSFLIETHNRG
jgi:hypothetical protein